MADDVSVRPVGRRNDRLGGGGPSPGSVGGSRRLIARLGRAATGALLALVWLLPGSVAAVEDLTISTPYPAVAVGPGSEVSFDITISAGSTGRVDLAVQGVPQGWTATLRGGGFVVNGVQVTPDAPAEITLEVDIPADASGNHQLTVRASADGQTTDLPLTLRIEEAAAGEVTLTTDFPALRGPSDVTFPFNLDLRNDTPEDLTFVVEAQAPEGWTATATVTGQERAASALVEAGTQVGIEVEVTPPETVAAGTVTIPVTAASGSQQASIDLSVEITGTYSMTVRTPDDRLNVRGAAGSQIRQTIRVENTGTSELEGVRLTSTAPQGWSVTFEPSDEVQAIPAGGEPVDVTAVITPSGAAVAGDYEVIVTASSDQAASEAVTLRVTVETSLLWGVIGVAIIVAVFAGLWWVFQRYGRR